MELIKEIKQSKVIKNVFITLMGTVLLAVTKSLMLKPLAFDEYCRFDTPVSFYSGPS